LGSARRRPRSHFQELAPPLSGGVPTRFRNRMGTPRKVAVDSGVYGHAMHCAWFSAHGK
jgi:hypothetical protein